MDTAYRLGKVCKRGHDIGTGHSLRYCTNNNCVICSRQLSHSWYQENREYALHYAKQWVQENRVKVRVMQRARRRKKVQHAE